MNAVTKAKISYMAYSSVLALCGTVFILLPEIFNKSKIYIIGGILLLCGIVKVIDYFINDTYGLAFQFDFAMGIFTILIGLILLLHPGEIKKFINIVIGIFAILDAAFKLQTAKDAKQFGMKYWNIILIAAMVVLTTGTLLIFLPLKSIASVVVLIGTTLIAIGIENLVVALYTVKLIRRSGPINTISDKGDSND